MNERVDRIGFSVPRRRSTLFRSTERLLARTAGSTRPLSPKGAWLAALAALDLLIAATVCAAQMPLYTRNPDDFRGLEKLIDVICV